MNIGTLTVLLGVNTAGLTRASMNMRRFETQVISSNTRMMGSFEMLASKMTLTGAMLTQYLTVPLGLLGTVAVKSFSDFEYQLGRITGLVGIASEQTKRWGNSILEMAGTVGETPKKLAESLYYITTGGVRSAESLDILKQSAIAAAAGLGETKMVANAITGVMMAYGQETMSSSRALNTLIKTIREGKGEPEEFVQNLGKISPVATKLGISLEEVGAAMAALTRTGTKVPEAATQVRRLLVTIIQQSPKSVKEFEKLGFTIDEVTDSLRERGLLATLLTLKEVVDKSTFSTAQNTEAWGDLFPRIRALLPVLDMLGPNLNNTKKIFEALGIQTDEFGRISETVADQVRFRWKQSMGALSSSLIEFGEVIKEPIIGLITQFSNFISSLVDKFTKLTTQQKGSIIAFATMTAVLGPLLLILGSMVGAIQGISRALFGLQLTNWIGKILLLGTAIYYSYKNWELLKQAIAGTAVQDQIRSVEILKEELFKVNNSWENYVNKLKERGQISPETSKYLQDVWKAQSKILQFQNEIESTSDLEKKEEIYQQYVQTLNELTKAQENVVNTSEAFTKQDFIKGTSFKGFKKGYDELQNYSKSAMLFTINTISDYSKKVTSALVDKEAYTTAENNIVTFGDFFKKATKDIVSDVTEGFNDLQKQFTGIDFFNINTGFSIGNEREVERMLSPLKKVEKQVWDLVANYKILNKEQEDPSAQNFIEAQTAIWEVINETNSALVANNNLAEMLGFSYDKTAADIAVLQKAINDLTKAQYHSKQLNKDVTLSFGFSPDEIKILQQYISLFDKLQQQEGLDELNRKIELLGNNTDLLRAKQQLLRKALNSILKETLPDTSEGIDAWIERVRKAQEELNALDIKVQSIQMWKTALTSTFSAIGEGIGNIVAGAEDGWSGLLEGLLNVVKQIGETLISIGTVLLFLSGGIGAAWIAAGITITALASAGLAKLADGGIIPPGYANDTFPAMLSSNEAVIPLTKLNTYLGNGTRNTGTKKVKLEIEGRKLVAFMDEMETFNNSY